MAKVSLLDNVRTSLGLPEIPNFPADLLRLFKSEQTTQKGKGRRRAYTCSVMVASDTCLKLLPAMSLWTAAGEP